MTEQTTDEHLRDALNGILDNLIGEEDRWKITLYVPMRASIRSSNHPSLWQGQVYRLNHRLLGKRNSPTLTGDTDNLPISKRTHSMITESVQFSEGIGQSHMESSPYASWYMPGRLIHPQQISEQFHPISPNYIAGTSEFRHESDIYETETKEDAISPSTEGYIDYLIDYCFRDTFCNILRQSFSDSNDKEKDTTRCLSNGKETMQSHFASNRKDNPSFLDGILESEQNAEFRRGIYSNFEEKNSSVRNVSLTNRGTLSGSSQSHTRFCPLELREESHKESVNEQSAELVHKEFDHYYMVPAHAETHIADERKLGQASPNDWSDLYENDVKTSSFSTEQYEQFYEEGSHSTSQHRDDVETLNTAKRDESFATTIPDHEEVTVRLGESDEYGNIENIGKTAELQPAADDANRAEQLHKSVIASSSGTISDLEALLASRRSSKSADVNPKWADVSHSLDHDSRILGVYTTDDATFRQPKNSPKLWSLNDELLKPSLVTHETTLTVSIEGPRQHILLSHIAMDMNALGTNNASMQPKIESESHTDETVLEPLFEEKEVEHGSATPSSNVSESAPGDFKDAKSVVPVVAKGNQTAPKLNTATATNTDKQSIGFCVKDRIKLEEEQIKLSKIPKMPALDGATQRKRSMSQSDMFTDRQLSDSNEIVTPAVRDDEFKFDSLSVHDRVVLKELELKRRMGTSISLPSRPQPLSYRRKLSRQSSSRSMSDLTQITREWQPRNASVHQARALPTEHKQSALTEDTTTPYHRSISAELSDIPAINGSHQSDGAEYHLISSVNVSKLVKEKERELFHANVETSRESYPVRVPNLDQTYSLKRVEEFERDPASCRDSSEQGMVGIARSGFASSTDNIDEPIEPEDIINWDEIPPSDVCSDDNDFDIPDETLEPTIASELPASQLLSGKSYSDGNGNVPDEYGLCYGSGYLTRSYGDYEDDKTHDQLGFRHSVRHLIQIKEDEILKVEREIRKVSTDRRRTSSENNESDQVGKRGQHNVRAAEMTHRKDTPPATPTALCFAKPIFMNATFDENDETAYVHEETVKAQHTAKLYSPGSVPEIAVQLVDGSNLQRVHPDGIHVPPQTTDSGDTIVNCVFPEVDNIAKPEAKRADSGSDPKGGVKSLSMESEQDISSVSIRKMSRMNKWIPPSQEEGTVRARREHSQARSYGSLHQPEGEVEKLEVRRVSRLFYDGPGIQRTAAISLDSGLNVSDRFDGVAPAGTLPPRRSALSPQLNSRTISQQWTTPMSGYQADKHTSERPHRSLTASSGKSVSSKPVWYPLHSYVPTYSLPPSISNRSNKPRPAPRHHYVPLLRQNFNRPITASDSTQPRTNLILRCKSVEYLAPFKKGPSLSTFPYGMNSKRNSLPLNEREANGNGTEAIEEEPLIAAVSSVSGANQKSVSPLGDRTCSVPRINRQPYVPRSERISRDDDLKYLSTFSLPSQSSSVLSPEYSRNDTNQASTFAYPLQENHHTTPKPSDKPRIGGELERPSSLSKDAKSFKPVHSYTGIEFTKVSPNGARIFSPAPFKYSPSPLYTPSSSFRLSSGDLHREVNHPGIKQPDIKVAEIVEFVEPGSIRNSSSYHTTAAFSLLPSRDSEAVVPTRTADLQSVPLKKKPKQLTRSPLGDYYRVFQPAAFKYRDPQSDPPISEASEDSLTQETFFDEGLSRPVLVTATAQLQSSFEVEANCLSPPLPSRPPPSTGETGRKFIYKQSSLNTITPVESSTSDQASDQLYRADYVESLSDTVDTDLDYKLDYTEASTIPVTQSAESTLLVSLDSVESTLKSPQIEDINQQEPAPEHLNPAAQYTPTALRSDIILLDSDSIRLSQNTVDPVRRPLVEDSSSDYLRFDETSLNRFFEAENKENRQAEELSSTEQRSKNATVFIEQKGEHLSLDRSLEIEEESIQLTSIVNSPGIAARNFQSSTSPSDCRGGDSNPLSEADSQSVPQLEMPEMSASSGAHRNTENLDSPSCAEWDPRLLVDKLYEIDYNPRKESKVNRFTNMEGHLEVPIDDKNAIAELQKTWAQRYFRTREGRLQWFASHFADDTPVGEVLLSDCDVKANRDDGTLSIYGGRDHVKMIVKVPLPTNLFDKWRKALTSHSGSSYSDSFVHPIYPPLPHITEKIAIVELGSCSIRAGVLTMEPSLPQCFFPTVALVKSNGQVLVGAAAMTPENRQQGEVVRPIHSPDPTLERYTIHKPALKACFQKCIADLHIDPKRYKILLSIPQSIPTPLIAEILSIVLEELRFQGAAISRQPSLTLYAYDVTTGVVVDIGDRLNIVPVIDGYVLDSAIVSLPYGALKITNALQSKLAETNSGLYAFCSPVERLILRYIMEQTCYVSTSYEEEVQKCKDNVEQIRTVVTLSDFKPTDEMIVKFNVDSARFTAPEGLFKPKRWGLDIKPLHKLVYEAVQTAPIDSRKTLFRNIYLAGGASLLPGLAERLEIELSTLVAPTIHTQVHLSPWRYNAAYLGAQVIASSTQFDSTCVTLDNLGQFIAQLQASSF